MPTTQTTPPTFSATEQLISVKDVCAIISARRTWVHIQTTNHRFPQPIHIGTRYTRWRASDVYAWMADPAGWIAAHAGVAA